MGFQNRVNLTSAPAVAGDFASSNPRTTVLAGPGGLVAGPGGVTVGKFGWVALDGITAQSYGTAPKAPDGFVHREQQALITQYLGEASNVIPVGFPVVMHNGGDFWVVNSGPSASAVGDAVYATYGTGDATMGAAATGATVTGAIGSTNTAAIGATFTATGSGTNLTVSAVTGVISIGDTLGTTTGISAGITIESQTSGTPGGAGVYVTSAATTISAATATSFGNVLVVSSTTGLISIGDTVSGGAGFPVGATIVNQISGTTGGAGSYTLSAPATAYVASATGVTTFGVVLNVTAVASGVLAVGDPISGSGIPSGAVIASQVSGTVGAIGIYTISVAATAYAASTTVTAVAGVLTNWKARSVAAVGELVKISTYGA